MWKLMERVVNLGVHDGLSEPESRRVRVTNAFSLIMILTTAPYIPLFAYIEHPMGRLSAVALGSACTLYMLTFYLNHRRLHYAAAVYLVAVGLAAIVTFTLLGGNNLGVEVWMFGYPVALQYSYLQRERRTKTLWIVAIAGIMVAMYILIQPHPWVGPPFSPRWQEILRVVISLGFYLCLGAFGVYGASIANRAEAALRVERDKSDRLLLSILPAPVADRLKEGPEVIAERHDDVTVLFADIVGFTPLSDRLEPEALVQLLNRIFTEFDAIVSRHGLEKIKTIGDAYMAVAGIPEPMVDHAEAAARAAREWLQAVAALEETEGTQLEIRVGLHSGPVVAGVIGRQKFSYDVWGDTVNLASRMESHGVVGRIQLTEATRERLGSGFETEERGEVDIKGKGAVRAYLLL